MSGLAGGPRRTLVAAIVATLATAIVAVAPPSGPSRAIAGESMRALVVAADVDTKLVRQVSAELSAQGFDVVVATMSPSSPNGTVESMAQASAAHAVVTIDEQARVARVWLAEAPTAPMTEVATFGPIGVSDDDDRVVAVRAAETIHAATIKLEKKLAALSSASAPIPSASSSTSSTSNASIAPSPAASTASASAPSPPTPIHDEERPRPFAVSLGVGFVASPGGLGVLVDGAAGASLRLGERWSVDALVYFPLGGTTLSEPEGSARAHVGIGGIDVARRLGSKNGAAYGVVAVGLAGARLSFEGNARPPFVGVADRVWAAVPFARGGVVFDRPPWSLRADVTLGLAIPEATAAFAGREVVHWGRPILIAAPSIAWTP